MKLRHLRRKALVGGAVSLGTAGLTNCTDGGSVDPPPPPLRCENLNALRDLRPTLTSEESGVLTARIAYTGTEPVRLQSTPRVSLVEGASVKDVRLVDEGRTIVVELVPIAPLPPRVWFVLGGTFVGGPTTCSFQRAFTITFDPELAIAESRSTLPFDPQARAAIAVTRSEGRLVGLRAVANPWGRVVWTVTGGTVVTEGDDAILWELPPDPGLYQAQLIVDHGEEGFVFDSLTFEVHPGLGEVRS